MIRVNENYKKLKASYLFAEISNRVSEFQQNNPDKELIKLGIGDVTKALPDSCIKAFHKAVDEMAADSSFMGYGPYEGYGFLREAIVRTDFESRGLEISENEIFVSDGAKCDSGNIQELFSNDIEVAVQDPVYPVYVDTNVMAGRTGRWENGRYEGLIYLDSTEKNNFFPELPDKKPDLIYLCFPNNPTGTAATKEQLQKWIDYARENRSLIIYDAAYESFIRDREIPHSIFEIEGAKEVAIEMRSLSKTAGFTGTRCAYTVIPDECTAYNPDGTPVSLKKMWLRRQSTKFNGVSYPVQRAAEAVYSPQGQKEIRILSDYYLKNAGIILTGLKKLGYTCTGGKNSPYIWVKAGIDSWDFFDRLLTESGIVCTPGSGFGKCGAGYIRISAFNSRENVIRAMDRFISYPV